MTFYDSSGSHLTKTQLLTLTTTPADADPPLEFTEDVFQTFDSDPQGGQDFESQSRLAFAAGQVVKTSVVNAEFVPATIASVSPNGGAAAGGTAVTITGTDFGGTSGVTFGGTAATNVKVVDNTKITCTAPAHAAGAVSVVVADDSGNVTEANAFTYA
jgi:hypothetical protein